MRALIDYFSRSHLLTNFLYIFILIGGLVFWNMTRKEELPEIAFDFVRISIVYPGASPEEVEKLVTWPIEKELQNLDGIEEIRSTSSESLSSITLDLQENNPDRDTIVLEIRNTVLSVKLPAEITETPQIMEFKNSKKAVIDLGIFFSDKKYLSTSDRQKLQGLVHTIENRLINLTEVHSVSKQGYLKEELQVLIQPSKLEKYQLPIRSVISSIQKANIRQPAGSLENSKEERVIVDGELTTIKELRDLPLQGNFEGRLIRIKDIAELKEGFEKTNKVYKINGREGVFCSIVKNADKGILESVDAIKKEVEKFQKQVGKKNGLTIIFFDDESVDVRNRIEIIKSNGAIGFILILTSLFLFLNFKTGFWVAAGIPFTFSVTIIVANFLGYTVNNITLAAVIIVMGMVVDDAIVVSENIVRLKSEGMPINRAVVEGTSYVLLPITASILTTCAAFFPLWAFEGRMAMFIAPIPSIVSLMLLASLIESIFILPAHIAFELPRPLQILFSLGMILLIEKHQKINKKKHAQITKREKVFSQFEKLYTKTLVFILRFSSVVVLVFFIFTVSGILIMTSYMKFSLFPREEVKEVRIRAAAPPNTLKYQTAKLAEDLEKIFHSYMGTEVESFVTYIGMSHFGTSATENEIWMRIELRDMENRNKTYKELANEWSEKMDKIESLENVRFSKRHFGVSSGSPIEIIVQENNNILRTKVNEALIHEMKKNPNLTNVQIGESYHSPEYIFQLKRDLLQRLGIEAEEVGTLLRSTLNGIVLYNFLMGDEEIDVRLSIQPKYKNKLEQILQIPVHNTSGYLIPLEKIVNIEKIDKPQEINRVNKQRITRILADFKPGAKITPLEVGEYLEEKVFPKMGSLSPNTIFKFDGEIKLTRESSGSLNKAIVIVLALIYTILALQFQSLSRPFLILLVIFPATSSVIYVFFLHGMKVYGLFGVIGSLGLAGVVVNDAIVLIQKLDDSFKCRQDKINISDAEFASVSVTRLRAVVLTTFTTVFGLFPTAYGVLGFDSMLSEMMLALSWGLVFGTAVTLILIPSLYKLLIKTEGFLLS